MANYLEISELLNVELAGKKVAMGRYDQILWKIRAGYLLVLSGALGFFVTKENPLILTREIIIIIFWFSLVALITDVSFRRRQLRVVKAYNELVTSAIKNIPQENCLKNIELSLLHISGENIKNIPTNKDVSITKCLFPSSLIYLGTMAISVLLYLLTNKF